MFRLFSLKLVTVVAVVAMALAGASSAFATSATDNTNPDLVVSASLLSNGSNPDMATVGNWVQVKYSVTNVGPNQWVRLFFGGSIPSYTLPDYSRLAFFPNGRSISRSVWIPVLGFFPTGLYTLNVAALGTGSLDPSSATASITIY